MSNRISEEVRVAVIEALTAMGLGKQRLGWSVEDFASVSGLGRTRLYAAIKAKQLRARKFGGRTIILDQDGRDFLAGLPEREAA